MTESRHKMQQVRAWNQAVKKKSKDKVVNEFYCCNLQQHNIIGLGRKRNCG